MNIKQPSDKPAKYVIGSNYRITLYSSSLIRVEYSKKGLWDDKNPILTEPTFKQDVPHKIKTKKNTLSLSTKHFQLRIILDGRRFDVGNLFFTVFKKGKKFTWQPGMTDEGNIGGAMLDLVKYPEGKLNEQFSEGLISKSGYFIYRNPCEFLWDNEKKWIVKKQDWESQDWYLFGYGDDFKKVFSDFIGLFGKIPMIPKWAFGYWYSKWYKFKDTDILEYIRKFKEMGTPLDIFVIDTDWRKQRWNGYEWNSEYFPNPSAFIQELKRQKIHFCLNDHPGYGGSDDLPPDDPYREKIRARVPELKEFKLRWSDQRYVSAWMEEIFSKFAKEGMDFWWVDGWGGTDNVPDLSAQLWTNRFYFESAKMAGDNRRAMILSRWGGIGAHKYPVQFSGDTHSSFETLKYQISFTHKGGNIGASYWSHDIGGFLGGHLEEDLFIRWLQFGCFSPIFRTHSSGSEREIWNYSPRVAEVFKKYVGVRYALVPYFYTLSKECHDTGIPLIRGLYLEYPKDENAFKFEEEYLIGKSLLVAPAYGAGDPFEREVYFPEGTWIALEKKEIVKGPAKKKIKIPLRTIPLYVKKGSIIPTIPVKENLSHPVTELELNIFPDRKTEFVYYEDDGSTENYRNGEYLTQKITVMQSGKKIKIHIEPISGSYNGYAEEINYKLNLLLNKGKPKSIIVNGERVDGKFTNKILCGTIDSPHKFLSIDISRRNRTHRTIIQIQTD